MLGVAVQCALMLVPVEVHGLCWQGRVHALNTPRVSLRQGAVVLYVCLPTGGCWEQRHLFPAPLPSSHGSVLSPLLILLAPLGDGLGALSSVAGRQPQAHCLPLSSWVKERQESVLGGHPFSLTQETLTVCEGFPFSSLPTDCLHALAGAPAAVLHLKVTPRMEAKETDGARVPAGHGASVQPSEPPSVLLHERAMPPAFLRPLSLGLICCTQPDLTSMLRPSKER